jgi:hypothetical protein
MKFLKSTIIIKLYVKFLNNEKYLFLINQELGKFYFNIREKCPQKGGQS